LTPQLDNPAPAADSPVFAELWTSLASLLRSYTVAHGLHTNRQAFVEHTPEKISVRHAGNYLILIRRYAIITWMRENGSMGTVELTMAGNLRNASHEESLDLAAEAWAHDIMREEQQ
jgi:hypothetical protein